MFVVGALATVLAGTAMSVDVVVSQLKGLKTMFPELADVDFAEVLRLARIVHGHGEVRWTCSCKK